MPLALSISAATVVRWSQRYRATGVLLLIKSAVTSPAFWRISASIIACVDAAPVFEFAEHVLDFVALAVEIFVKVSG